MINKTLILAFALCLSTFGQTKSIVQREDSTPSQKETLVIEGVPCALQNGGSSYLLSPTPTLIAPLREIWVCENFKWHHDRCAETKRDIREALVERAREGIRVRKLTKEEIGVIYEVVHSSSSYSGFSCSGDGCIDRMECGEDSITTAELVAQLSFWNPPESELPLSMLQSYVKGMICDVSTRRAYQIMNERIIAWLTKQWN